MADKNPIIVSAEEAVSQAEANLAKDPENKKLQESLEHYKRNLEKVKTKFF